MLKNLSDPDRSSKCSCGQMVPDSYDADPSCCSRGTELLFTWRMNGNFEIRLNNRLMDVFPRPDLAKGMFFEYMRSDDPISPEARMRFADGIPSLIAPLPFEGKSSSSSSSSSQKKPKKAKEKFDVDVGAVLNFARGTANNFANGVKKNVLELQVSERAEYCERESAKFRAKLLLTATSILLN